MRYYNVAVSVSGQDSSAGTHVYVKKGVFRNTAGDRHLTAR